jgi:hypothetical protein
LRSIVLFEWLVVLLVAASGNSRTGAIDVVWLLARLIKARIGERR